MKLEKFCVQTFKDPLLLLNTRPVSWLDDTWILEVWKLGEVKPNPDEFKKILFASQLYEFMDWYWAIEQSKSFKLLKMWK